MLFLMSGNNEFLGECKSERLKELLTNPFAEENILWVTLIIWCTVEIILSLVSHTTIHYKVGYGLWYSLSVSYLNNQEELFQEDILPIFPIKGNPRFLSLLQHDRVYIKTYNGNVTNYITCYFIFNFPIREWVGDFLLTTEEIIWIEPILWRPIPFNRFYFISSLYQN